MARQKENGRNAAKNYCVRTPHEVMHIFVHLDYTNL